MVTFNRANMPRFISYNNRAYKYLDTLTSFNEMKPKPKGRFIQVNVLSYTLKGRLPVSTHYVFKAVDTGTKVMFLLDKGPDVCVYAFFPESGECYAKVDGHASCTREYVKSCKAATEEQYRPLVKELEAIGYTLKVLNKH